jgi:DNA-damage-inducible protein D
MKKSVITRLHAQFKDIVHREDEAEYWFARELQPLLGYAKWSSFERVIEKAKVACATTGQSVTDHFADVGRMVDVGSTRHPRSRAVTR